MRKSNPSFLNGVPELVILRLLANREMYGYELVRAIQVQSKDVLNFGEGCVYPILHSLEEGKLVTSRRKDVEGRSRNYYCLTGRGRGRLETLTKEWQEVAGGVTLVLGGANA